MLESRWHLDFHSPAFGVTRAFFHIQTDDEEFTNIIPIHDSNNTILNVSDIFVNRELPMDYIGFLYVPDQDTNALEEYLRRCERNKVLKLKKFAIITSYHRSISLDHYNLGKGWLKVKPSYLHRIADEISKKKTNPLRARNNLDYLSSPFNQKWKFTQHKLPEEVIKIYCDTPSELTYSDLKLTSVTNNKNPIVSLAQRGLLKQLNYNRVLNINWVPWQLVYEFSRDYYWVILPKVSIQEINPLLKLLPISMISLSEESTQIWTYLTSQLAQWIREDLQGEVYSVTQYINPQTLNYNWFDQEKSQWRTPQILN